MTGVWRRDVLRSLAGVGGLVGVLALLMGSSLVPLDFRKARVTSLRHEIQEKQAAVERYTPDALGPADLQAAEGTLLDWQRMTASESDRIAELSAAARAVGVTIVSLNGLQRAQAEDPRIVSSSTELSVVGAYREIASFLDGVYAARGMAAVEDLRIEHETGSQDLLRASLIVTWYAPGADSAFLAQGTAE